METEHQHRSTRFDGNLWKIYTCHVLGSLHFISAVLVPFYTDWGGISFAQVLLLQSWFMAWAFLLEIPTGTVADRFGRKTSFVLGLVANTLAVVVYTSVPLFLVFMAGEFLWALSIALVSGADAALVYDGLKADGRSEESDRVFRTTGMLSKLAMLVAGPVGSVIALTTGYKETMLFMIFPLAIATAISLTIKEPPRDGTPEPGATGTEKHVKHAYIRIMKAGIKEFTGSKSLRRLAANMIAVDSVAFMLVWVYQVKLAAAGIPVLLFGMVNAMSITGQVAVIGCSGRLERALGSRSRLLLLAPLVLAAALVLLACTNEPWMVITAITVAISFGLSRRPLFESCFNKHISSATRATVLSTIAMLRTMCLAIVDPVVGMLVEANLDATILWLGVFTAILATVTRVREQDL